MSRSTARSTPVFLRQVGICHPLHEPYGQGQGPIRNSDPKNLQLYLYSQIRLRGQRTVSFQAEYLHLYQVADKSLGINS